jgi:hypothetical protein
VAVFTNIGFCGIIALQAIGPPAHIPEFAVSRYQLGTMLVSA